MGPAYSFHNAAVRLSKPRLPFNSFPPRPALNGNSTSLIPLDIEIPRWQNQAMQIDVNVPDGQCGDWRVETYNISKSAADFANLRAACGRPLEAVTAGTYKKLTHRGNIVMTNTPMEIRTNQPIIRRAQGRVLLNGLGLGVVLAAILKNPELIEVTVVEKHHEVIKLVAPAFADSRVTIIHADTLLFTPPKRIKFNAVWHDIWNEICADNLPSMRLLHRKYARKTFWQDSWAREWIQA